VSLEYCLQTLGKYPTYILYRTLRRHYLDVARSQNFPTTLFLTSDPPLRPPVILYFRLFVLQSVGLRLTEDISYADFLEAFGTKRHYDVLPTALSPDDVRKISTTEDDQELNQVLRKMICENPVPVYKVRVYCVVI